ncbi:conjugal transfer protein TraG N-terminal domain-containing protein [Shewanella morhuae]|uniref:TraG-like protein, N-terminal region n=1 Tax=Shewanella morhuae TaxID=365591 RepID=A0A380BZG6_9GAMM|nr:conjugal transfer protein TraG N-terminal domain-containing protein [Shewanella morhuae]SUJ10025.1 TraG-like protein, N-terminal region [Shewanella morhuae]
MWEIYSVGNAAFLIDVFNGLARLWSTGDIYVLLSTALVIGLIWNSLQWATNQEKMPFPAKGFILSIIFVVGLLGPQSLVDVRITSKRDYSFQEINNVPLLPALGGWLISNSGTAIADLMAQAFSTVGIDTWEALSPIQHFVGLSDINFSDMCTPNPLDKNINVCKSFNYYLEDCFTTANLISPSSTNPIDPVLNAKPVDILNELKVTNPNLYTLSYLAPGNANGEHMKCEAAWNKLSGYMKSTQFTDNMQKSLAAQGSDLSKVTQFLTQYSTQGVIPAAESSLDLANAAFLSSIFNNYFTNSPYGEQVSRAMFDTVRQRQLANASKKEYWMENAEVMQSFFEALTVFLTPFLGLVLAVSGQGLMAVGQYFAAWMFVQLWSVMIVLVNLFTALAMTNRFNDAVAAGKSQFSLTAIDSQFATANSYISIAGMLYTFIPAICVFVLYRGVHAMQGMAKQAMADPNINAQRLSPDTGATVQNGNATYGNQTSQLENNTGRHINGDSLVSTSMGQYSVGSSMGGSSSAGASKMKSQAETFSANAQKALDQIFNNSKAGGIDFNTKEETAFTASSMSELATATTNALVDATGMSRSTASQLVAAGAVKMDAGGALSFGGGFSASNDSTSREGGEGKSSSKGVGIFGKLGVQAGAEITGSVGLNSSAADELRNNVQKSLNLSDSQIEKINSNLSKIKGGSEVSSFSDKASIQENAKQASAFMRQAQAAEQQQIMLSNMATNSGQVSQSKQLDIAGMATDLQQQSIGSYLSAQNPELWEKIKNTEIDGKSGDKWLTDKEVESASIRSAKSGNAVGEGRANAIMSFMDKLDNINMNSNGTSSSVDIAKEKNDAEINRDIYGALSANGVVNADAGVGLYQNKVDTLDNMAKVTTALDNSRAELARGTSDIPNSNDFNEQYESRVSTAGNQISEVGNIAKNGQEQALLSHTAYGSEFNEKGEELLGGKVSAPSQDKARDLESKSNDLNKSNAATAPILGAVSGIIPTVADAIKPGGETAFNNFTESQVKKGEDISSYRPEYAAAVGKIGDIEHFSDGSMQDRLTSTNQDKVTSAQEIINLLSDDKLMTSILGKDGNGNYGTGTESTKAQFDENTMAMLSQGATWLQNYQSNKETPAIAQAIDEAKSLPGNGVKTYLAAMQDLGIMHSATSESDGKVFNGDTARAAEGLSKILDTQESSQGRYGLMRDTIDGSRMTSGTIWYPAGDREASRDELNVRLNDIQNLAENLGGMLSPEQKNYVDKFISDSREKIQTDSGDRPGKSKSDSAQAVDFTNANVGGR